MNHIKTLYRSETRHHPDRGLSLLLVAILLAVLMGFVGLAIDTAGVRYTAQRLQAAADSAALAAVQEVRTDDPATDFLLTRQAAVTIAAANEAGYEPVLLEENPTNAPQGDIVVGRWSPTTRTFTPDVIAPDAVQVSARRTDTSAGGPLDLVFGPVFGTSQSNVARTAIAHVGRSSSPAVILILDPTINRAFDTRGDALLTAYDGRIQVNSTASQALYLNGAPGAPRVRAGQIRVVGTSSYPAGSLDPQPIDNSPPEPDPLMHLPYPDPASMTDHGGITSGGSYQPGYYPDGIDLNGGLATLSAGVYYFGAPRGIEINGTGLVVGDDVVLFLEEGAPIVIAGNSPGLDISSPGSGPYEGISVFAHRNSVIDFEVSGGGVFEVDGTMYMKRGHLEMDGNVVRRIGRIVVNTQQLRGNGQYIITGEGPPDTGPLSAYLVR